MMSKFLRGLSDRDWTTIEYELDKDKIRFQEAILTLGNGYLGSRGILEEGYEAGHVGNYIAGIYDKSEAQSFVIVNVPNPFLTEIYVDGQKLSVDEMEVVEHRRVLDMRRAVLFRRTIFEDDGGRYEYESRRFLSLKNMHLGVVNLAFRSLDRDASVVLTHTIDASTRNEMQAVGDPIKHYVVTKTSHLGDDLSYLEARTRDLRIAIGIATTGGITHTTSAPRVKSDYRTDEESVIREYSFRAKDSIRYEFQHYISVHTSRDTEGDVETACLESVEASREQGVTSLLREHSKAWRSRWESCDIEIEGDPPLQTALRFDMYHLLAAAPPQDIDASIAPKALSGEWYGGHVFWDAEIYMLPFFIHSQPELAKAFLMYRYRRLPQAKSGALEQDYKGALWPWESAESGEDETPDWWVNFDGTVLPVHNSKREHHIASDIVYAIYRYDQASGDEDFKIRYGSEMIFETARFWESRMVYNDERKAYDIRMVIGPNEFQEGVDNNSYTNGLARWMLRYAADIYARLQETHPDELGAIADKIGLTAEEVGTWEQIADQLVFLMDHDGLIEEFEGYFQRENVVIRGWDKHGMPAWPTEVALANVKETQLIKQGDVVLLLYLLSDEFSLETKKLNFDYYEPRTTHMSSLSITPYAILATELCYWEKAYKYLHHTAESDLEDIHRNSERGVHAAELGGAWQIMIHGFAGLSVKNSVLSVNPVLHESWRTIRFRTWFRGNQVEFAISRDKTAASMVKGKDPVDVEIHGKRQLLNPGRTVTVKR